MENIKLPAWQKDAQTPDEYHCCEMRRGREFMVRMMTGADPCLAIARFAKENNIRFGKVHATFMGGFQPCKYFVWIPDYANPDNWHREGVAVNTNLTMLTSIGGMIGERPIPGKEGETEPFVAMHFVAGGGWDAPVITGHLVEGTRVKGCMQVFITELLDIDVLAPVDVYHEAYSYPENFYYNTKKGKPED